MIAVRWEIIPWIGISEELLPYTKREQSIEGNLASACKSGDVVSQSTVGTSSCAVISERIDWSLHSVSFVGLLRTARQYRTVVVFPVYNIRRNRGYAVPLESSARDIPTKNRARSRPFLSLVADGANVSHYKKSNLITLVKVNYHRDPGVTGGLQIESY